MWKAPLSLTENRKVSYVILKDFHKKGKFCDHTLLELWTVHGIMYGTWHRCSIAVCVVLPDRGCIRMDASVRNCSHIHKAALRTAGCEEQL